MMTRSVLSTARSGCERASTCARTAASSSGDWLSRAVAKAKASVDRPEPGGPVISQEWVIAAPEPPLTLDAAAASTTEMASDCPVSSSHSPMEDSLGEAEDVSR